MFSNLSRGVDDQREGGCQLLEFDCRLLQVDVGSWNSTVDCSASYPLRLPPAAKSACWEAAHQSFVILQLIVLSVRDIFKNNISAVRCLVLHSIRFTLRMKRP